MSLLASDGENEQFLKASGHFEADVLPNARAIPISTARSLRD